MKRLILVCGANGIGKSTTCKKLVEKLNASAYIDSDYCRYMNPFSFSQDEVNVIVSNISTMMINFFRLNTIDNVIFQYGFHGIRKQIFDSILQQLKQNNIVYSFHPIILECELEENIKRMHKDNRDEQRITRAIENTREIYDQFDYPRIDITSITPEQTAAKIIQIIEAEHL